MSTVPTNINNYLRQFAHQLEERILQQFPPLHQPGEPFPANWRGSAEPPIHAQALAIAGISKRWEVENSAARNRRMRYRKDAHLSRGDVRQFERESLSRRW